MVALFGSDTLPESDRSAILHSVGTMVFSMCHQFIKDQMRVSVVADSENLDEEDETFLLRIAGGTLFKIRSSANKELMDVIEKIMMSKHEKLDFFDSSETGKYFIYLPWS